MIITLTVYAVGNKNLSTAVSTGFDSERMDSIRANPDSNIYSGAGTFFVYYTGQGTPENYVVSQSVSDIATLTAGGTATGTTNEEFAVDSDNVAHIKIKNNAGAAELYNQTGTTLADFYAGDLQAGKSGVAGYVTSYPTTAAKGSLRLVAADNGGDFLVQITNASHGQATAVTIPDSGLATSYVLQSTAAITVAEANVLDGATAGTQVANKVVVADANVNTGISKVTELHIGATGAEVQVTSTPAELNLLDGSSTANSVAGKAPVLDSDKALRTTANPGTVPGTVTTVDYGDGKKHTTVCTVTNLDLGTIAGAANESTGALFFTFPAGAIVVKAAYMSIGLTNTDGNIDADTPDLGIGTTVGSGANATLNAVGAAAENILTGQTANNVTGTAEVKTVADQILVIEAAGDHTCYLNIADNWAGAETVGVIANGTIVLEWVLMA